MGEAALSGRRVVDLSSWIAGAYATKLLADAGADVVKVEDPTGDPLRRWSASGTTLDGDGPLFNFLGASKQGVVAEADAVHELLAGAEVAVWSRGSTVADQLVPAELVRSHPHLTVVAITPFGLEGPWAGRPATEFTLQAWSGGVVGLARGRPDRAPVFVGGQVGEWVTGLFAAIGALASRRRGDGVGELVDVSMMEALALTLTYQPVTFNDQLGYPMRRKRFVPTPGVGQARDGLVGLGCGTGQQWLDFCVMVGHPEWTEDKKLFLDRTALTPTIDEWIAGRTVDEVLDLASAFRIPNAPIVDGANAAGVDHFRQRGTFVTNPKDGVTNPRPAYRLGTGELRRPTPAPALGEHTVEPGPPPVTAEVSGRLPFAGLRVLDMTSFWAGPLTGHLLALLGAEVIHLESTKRPDGARLVGGVPESTEQHWERGPIFNALNTNKKGLTLDLDDERGKELFHRVLATCDAFVENATPRVLDQLGLGVDDLLAAHPELIVVRMPGFGLDGPWRDLPAFAFVIEDASGLTSLTGHPDLLPFEPYCLGDPNAGLHALFALQVALEQRDRTGEGGLVEAAMVDAALNITAEQVVEHSAHGVVLERAGNRGPMAAPQGLYLAADEDAKGRRDTWVAIAVADDDQWVALQRALGEPPWATDPALGTAAGRVERHDAIDEHLSAWCGERSADEVVDQLWPAGVPVARVVQPHLQPELDQFRGRGFFEELDRPVVGRSRYSTLPFRLSRGPDEWHRRPAPLLGEHNHELLTELGLSEVEIDRLEADGVIGRSLVRGQS